jgi:hypothetical protein
MTKTKILRRFLWLALAAFCGILLFAGCNLTLGEDDLNKGSPGEGSPGEGSPGEGGTNASGIDWTNYQTEGTYSIRVRNESNRDLVAFKGSLAPENLIGGVKKNEGNHGLPLNTTLFNENKDFPLVFLTLEDYNAYKGNLKSREQYPFARVFAVYNKNGTNEHPFEVDSKLGGTNKLILHNLSGYNMEIRRNSLGGATLGYAPSGTNNTTLYITDGAYNLFIIYKKYNPLRDQVITIYPKRLNSDLPVMIDYSFENGEELTINGKDWTDPKYISGFSSGYAFLTVQNQLTDSGISVSRGGQVEKTATGNPTINPGTERTYLVPMRSVTAGNTTKYEDTTTFSGWSVGPTGEGKPIPVSEELEKENGLDVFEADYMYTVTVSGNFNMGNMTITPPKKGIKIGLDEIADAD